MTHSKLLKTPTQKRMGMAKQLQTSSAILGLLLVSATSGTLLQTAMSTMPETSPEVKIERNEFVRTHTYDYVENLWMLKNAVAAPKSAKPRSSVKGMSDTFMLNNRYKEASSRWVPLGNTLRDLGQMTRQRVRHETLNVMRNHDHGGDKGMWVLK